MSHPTRSIQVWVDVDEGIADVVIYLNTIDGLRTHASCQGGNSYPAQVMVTWDKPEILERLRAEFKVEILGECCAYVHPLSQH